LPMGAALCPEKDVPKTDKEHAELGQSFEEEDVTRSVRIHQNTDERDPHMKATNLLMMTSVELKIVTDKGVSIRPLTVAPGKSIYICDVIPSDDGKMFDLMGNAASSFRVAVSQKGGSKASQELEVSNPEDPQVQQV